MRGGMFRSCQTRSCTVYTLSLRECVVSVPVCMKIVKNSRWFRPRRAVGFDRAGGAIESNCPSGSKSSRIFQNFHAHRDGTVHTVDGTQYTKLRFCSVLRPVMLQYETANGISVGRSVSEEVLRTARPDVSQRLVCSRTVVHVSVPRFNRR